MATLHRHKQCDLGGGQHVGRLFVRDPAARTQLKEVIDRLNDLHHLDSVALEPVIVPRMDKLPVIVRIWPFEGPSHPPGQDVRALLTLNALGPRPGPPAPIIAKTFRLTPSEAKLACIIARGAPPGIAAREFQIDRSARSSEQGNDQLKGDSGDAVDHRPCSLISRSVTAEAKPHPLTSIPQRERPNAEA